MENYSILFFMHKQGNLSSKYKVVPRVLIFIFKGNDVLLIHKKTSSAAFGGKYNGVGGHIERGEDVCQAALRELNEETGLRSVELMLCGTMMIDVGPEVGISLYIFGGLYKFGRITSSIEGDIEWIPKTNISRIMAVEDLKILVAQTEKAMKTGKIYFGTSCIDAKGELRIAINNQDFS